MARRRENVPFDPFYFESLARAGVTYTIEETFRHIYGANHWGGAESVSGAGASADQTRELRRELPALVRSLGADALLDLPCGDFSWMSAIDLPVRTYIGADILPELVARNQARYGDRRRRFVVLDITRDPLPAADLLLCRDCLVHLSFADIRSALANVRRSPITYLLTTTFPACEENEEITTGDWRLLNLELPPFDFPAPLRLIDEGCSEGGGEFRDKSLGLWRVADILV